MHTLLLLKYTKDNAAKSLRGIAVEAVKSASLLGREYIPFYS